MKSGTLFTYIILLMMLLVIGVQASPAGDLAEQALIAYDAGNMAQAWQLLEQAKAIDPGDIIVQQVSPYIHYQPSTPTPTKMPTVTPTKTPKVTSTVTPNVTPTKTPMVTPTVTPNVTPTKAITVETSSEAPSGVMYKGSLEECWASSKSVCAALGFSDEPVTTIPDHLGITSKGQSADIITDLSKITNKCQPSENSVNPSIPTKDNPLWTGNLKDDPDEILLARLIMGEARDDKNPELSMEMVAWVVKNRVLESKTKGYSDIILARNQFEVFKPVWHGVNESDITDKQFENFAGVLDPKSCDSENWNLAYGIATKVINTPIESDPIHGGTIFYVCGDPTKSGSEMDSACKYAKINPNYPGITNPAGQSRTFYTDEAWITATQDAHTDKAKSQ